MQWKRSRAPQGCPEIVLPPKRPKVNIFADFETFLYTDGYPLWKHREEEKFSAILAEKCEVVPWLLGAYMPAIKASKGKPYVDLEDYRLYTSARYPHEDFFQQLRAYYDAGCLPVIWFHNTSYDLTAAIETAFRELDPDLKIYFIAKDSKAFLLGAMESPKYGFKAKFGDTLLYRRISLAEIGRMFGSDKGEIPYTMMDLYIRDSVVYFTDWFTGNISSIPLSKCVEYVAQDVHLLHMYHRQLMEETELITVAVNGTKSKRVRVSTQGVHARSLLDLWMQKQSNGQFENVFKFEVSPEEGMLMQRSLTGGYTTLNSERFSHICAPDESITSFDCNSLYPYIMTLGIPCGHLQDTRPKGKYLEWVCISCSDVKWTGIMGCLKTPPIPENKQSHSMEEPTKIYVTRQFLDFVRENSEGSIEVHWRKYQRITHTAGAFISYIYDVRKNLKNQWQEMEEELERGKFSESEAEMLRVNIDRIKTQEKGVKTTMNSLYGKLCEKSYLSQTVYLDGHFRRVPEEVPLYRCTLTGAFIAMEGRRMLYTKIKRVLEAGFTFLYADTDSVKFAYKRGRERDIEEIFGINTGELGQWKNEGRWDEFHSPGKKKKYTLINYKEPKRSEIKLSGISDNPYITALKNGLYETKEKTLDDLRYIFSSTSNVLFKNAKNNTTRTLKYDQVVIHPIHVSSNVSVGKNTAEVYIEGGRYVLKKYESKGTGA